MTIKDNRCYFCSTGQIEEKRVSVTLFRDGEHVIIEEVPAEVCDSCGERTYDSQTTEHILQIAENVFETGTSEYEKTVPAERFAG